MEIYVGEYNSKREMYQDACKQLQNLIGEETDQIALLANTSALLNQFLENVNWVGFYLCKNDALILGPFQGKTAVSRIEKGKGVCGTAFQEEKLQRVDDVHSCCNHIACDFSSASEIVVPIWKNHEMFGVLDIDSPVIARFDSEDEEGLKEIVNIISHCLL